MAWRRQKKAARPLLLPLRRQWPTQTGSGRGGCAPGLRRLTHAYPAGGARPVQDPPPTLLVPALVAQAQVAPPVPTAGGHPPHLLAQVAPPLGAVRGHVRTQLRVLHGREGALRVRAGAGEGRASWRCAQQHARVPAAGAEGRTRGGGAGGVRGGCVPRVLVRCWCRVGELGVSVVHSAFMLPSRAGPTVLVVTLHMRMRCE